MLQCSHERWTKGVAFHLHVTHEAIPALAVRIGNPRERSSSSSRPFLSMCASKTNCFVVGLRFAHSMRRAWPASCAMTRWVLDTPVAVKISFKSSTRLRVEGTANGGDIVVRARERRVLLRRHVVTVLPLGGFVRASCTDTIVLVVGA